MVEEEKRKGVNEETTNRVKSALYRG